MDVCWMASRWDKGETKDYINCPMTREQYQAFHAGLMAGEKTEFKEWEHNTPYFNGCQPIEVIAASGPQTLRFGPMKPVGLDNPRTGRWAHAVVQLRQDNKQGTLWNMVGFQTKMKHAAQVELFRTIPGLEKAEFARLGGLHRNTFIRSPILLDRQLRLKSAPHIRFAGQITGCEGYVESSAVGGQCFCECAGAAGRTERAGCGGAIGCGAINSDFCCALKHLRNPSTHQAKNDGRRERNKNLASKNLETNIPRQATKAQLLKPRRHRVDQQQRNKNNNEPACHAATYNA